MSKSKSNRISQSQIANELGFSQALVSMALNGRKKGISEKTYKTIWDYAIQQGYSPRGMNIETAKENTSVTTIGYILRSPLKLANTSNFFSHIHQGLHDRLNSNAIKTIFLGSEDDIAQSLKQSPLILPESLKGIAIMGEVQPEFFKEIRSLGKPIVCISSRATGKCHSVLSNEEQSAELLVDHLYSLGHTEFAWLGGNQHMGRFSDRLEGLMQALESRGLNIDSRFILKNIEADRKEGSEFARKIIEICDGSNLPTAWICLNGLIARGAVNCLFQNGYKVGSDVSVAAIDMTRVCQEENPTITCAGADPEILGSEAGRILMTAISGESPALSDVTLPSTFLAGESTGPAPVSVDQAD
ncbi:LacI family transcriptional regulator [Opitutaceae bacterium]|nr:LacI family transcriptional regulator [Opitutaceae bacterium]